jgi:hypothetical protein
MWLITTQRWVRFPRPLCTTMVIEDKLVESLACEAGEVGSSPTDHPWEGRLNGEAGGCKPSVPRTW